jgi:Conserved TM helix
MVLADIDISQSVQRTLDQLFGFLPELVGALAILAIGYLVARLVGAVVTRASEGSGLDRTLMGGRSGAWVGKLTTRPSRLLGRLTYWGLLLGAIAVAVSALGIEALTSFVAVVFGYVPNLVAALLIFLVAGAVAAGVGALVARTMGDTPTGKVVGTVVPGIVMAIAVFMILNQLKVAPEIVTITYAALIGSFALAAALAFGLGGREVAADMLRGAYLKGQQQKEQVRQDLRVGKDRAREDIQRAREVVEADQEPAAATVAAANSPGRRPLR